MGRDKTYYKAWQKVRPKIAQLGASFYVLLSCHLEGCQFLEKQKVGYLARTEVSTEYRAGWINNGLRNKLDPYLAAISGIHRGAKTG